MKCRATQPVLSRVCCESDTGCLHTRARTRAWRVHASGQVAGGKGMAKKKAGREPPGPGGASDVSEIGAHRLGGEGRFLAVAAENQGFLHPGLIGGAGFEALVVVQH